MKDTITVFEMADKKVVLFEKVQELLIDIGKLQEENKKLVEALKFYENCSMLMLKQRSLPIDPILGRSVLTEKHIQDNGDVARQVLKEVGEE